MHYSEERNKSWVLEAKVTNEIVLKIQEKSMEDFQLRGNMTYIFNKNLLVTVWNLSGVGGQAWDLGELVGEHRSELERGGCGLEQEAGGGDGVATTEAYLEVNR